MTPMQLYVDGLLATECSVMPQESSGLPSRLQDLMPEEIDLVEIPTNKFIPCQQVVNELNAINPGTRCTDFGKQFYKQCIQVLGQHLQINCNTCHL